MFLDTIQNKKKSDFTYMNDNVLCYARIRLTNPLYT